jgi:hypothetical protein
MKTLPAGDIEDLVSDDEIRVMIWDDDSNYNDDIFVLLVPGYRLHLSYIKPPSLLT